jgi:L-malate glycosyltransferase
MYVTNGLGYGGAERIVEALATAMFSQGHAVTVVATTRDGPIGERLRGFGIPTHILGIRHPLDGSVAIQLTAIAHRFRPDIVHSHLAVADIAAATLPRLVCPVRLSTVHNPGREVLGLKRWLWHHALRRFDGIQCVSRDSQSGLPCGLDAEVRYLSLAQDPISAETRRALRAGLGLEDDAIMALSVGRLHSVKGFDILAASLKARSHGRKVRFFLVGDGPERLQLANRPEWTWLGPRDDADQLIAASDLLVSPSRSEGLPQTVLQAMRAGVPVLATQVGGIPELIQHAQTGWLIPPESAEALSEALVHLLGSPQTRRQLGLAGQRRILEKGLTQESMLKAAASWYARSAKTRVRTGKNISDGI